MKWEVTNSNNEDRPGYKIKIFFQPKNINDEINGLLSIFTNDKKYSKLDILVVGRVKKEIEICPEICFFVNGKNSEEILITFKRDGNKIKRIETSSPFIKTELFPKKQNGYKIKVSLLDYPQKFIKEKIVFFYTSSYPLKIEKIEIPVYGIVERR